MVSDSVFAEQATVSFLSFLSQLAQSGEFLKKLQKRICILLIEKASDEFNKT